MSTRVELNTNNIEFEIAKFINENSEDIANRIESDAKATSLFSDKTGHLRRSIKAKKSKFEEGGWIVRANAQHAWIIEHGRKGTQARPFLRTALNNAIEYARSQFGAR